MGVLHMPTAAGHHPLKSCPRHEAPPQIILKSVTFTMTTESPPRAPPPVRAPAGPQKYIRYTAGPFSSGKFSLRAYLPWPDLPVTHTGFSHPPPFRLLY